MELLSFDIRRAGCPLGIVDDPDSLLAALFRDRPSRSGAAARTARGADEPDRAYWGQQARGLGRPGVDRHGISNTNDTRTGRR
ncbi:hypothetical protein KGY14_12865 [Ameyamaea chiangmaiensis]|uniref:Uncharacterized protein n=1 Tax=Ameyamaea chiangmaiensis TaxID=442969 RepID=A0A850PFG7_9PROT|nr:hypothetical protein [Ameyamaea chiangmaiensis]MBS4076081.1 hypothetical protein [Ameyamaea chiangmaiensis]NVN40986.1 hypothetical protein [Ameyamaea chiangmaiensis]